MAQVSYTYDQLVRLLCGRIRGLFSGVPFRQPGGDEVAGPVGSDAWADYTMNHGLKVYAHSAPVALSGDEERGADEAPYCIVRATGGSFPDTVSATVAFLLWDDRPDNRGDADLLNAIQTLQTDLARHPSLGGFRQEGNMDWTAGDTDIWPYFCGATTITFRMSGIDPEDDFA